VTDAQSHSNGPSLVRIERPRCAKCNERMHLTRIMPGPKGHDLRNFECDKCDQVVTLTVVTDPMKSSAMRWLAADLNPPK
jgi:hypothetical protein